MTQREKVLTTGLLGLLVAAGAGVLFHLFVYEPVSEVRTRLEAEREELQQKKNELVVQKKQIADILRVNPRLLQWSQLSLPPRDPELKKANLPPEEQKRKHLADLRVAYEAYLSGLMEKAGFRRDSIKVDVRATGRAPTQLKGQDPPYEQLTFGATGRGKMDAVARMMQEFHRTPLLHHVRSASLGLIPDQGGKKADGTLEMNLTIDALLVNGGEDRAALQPKGLAVTPKVLAYDPKLPASSERNYLAMNKRNMFMGYEPTPAAKVINEPTAPKATTEERREVLRFVKLTTLAFDPERKRWEAWLYDQGKGGKEKKLNNVLDEFTIDDKDGHAMIEAKVVKIAEEFMVILSEGKYYRLKCGDFLYPAIRTPLSKADLKASGITPDESAKEKKD